MQNYEEDVDSSSDSQSLRQLKSRERVQPQKRSSTDPMIRAFVVQIEKGSTQESSSAEGSFPTPNQENPQEDQQMVI